MVKKRYWFRAGGNPVSGIQMIKKILFVLLAFSTAANAESYLYWGKYMNSTLSAYPGSSGVFAASRAGIHVECSEIPFVGTIPCLSFFVENECLMDGGRSIYSYPSSMNFKIGAKYTGDIIDVIYQHECKHPFGMRSDIAEDYDLVEIRYKLTQ